MIALLLAGCGQQQDARQADSAAAMQLNADEAKQIAKEAYIFGYPFVANYRVYIDRMLDETPGNDGC